MPHELRTSERIDAARADLRQAVTLAFCNVMRESRLPPTTVMALVAEAIGSIYRDVATAHANDPTCPCGWQPCPDRDVETLQTALAATALSTFVRDLRLVQAAGRA